MLIARDLIPTNTRLGWIVPRKSSLRAIHPSNGKLQTVSLDQVARDNLPQSQHQQRHPKIEIGSCRPVFQFLVANIQRHQSSWKFLHDQRSIYCSSYLLRNSHIRQECRRSPTCGIVRFHCQQLSQRREDTELCHDLLVPLVH